MWQKEFGTNSQRARRGALGYRNEYLSKIPMRGYGKPANTLHFFFIIRGDCNRIFDYLVQCYDKVVFGSLPRGSARLNSIEECWRQCKHKTLDSESYESFDDTICTVIE